MNIFLQRYQEILGDEYKKLLNVKLKTCIRVNTLKIEEKAIVERLKNKKIILNKITFTDYGYFVESKFSIGSTPEYLQGYYYTQEAASQLPVQILAPKKEDLVLDMAAAPGGKTTQIAQYMENKGALIAVDNSHPRLLALKNNIERCGVSNSIIYKKDSKFVCDLNLKFDKIMLDAPCSGNFINDIKWFDRRDLEDFAEIAKLQKQLLKAAVEVLKPKGTLVYSTCSMEPEQNEEVIDWALRNLDIKVENIEISVGSPGLTEFQGKKYSEEVKKCIRMWPHKTGTQGFFIAKLSLR